MADGPTNNKTQREMIVELTVSAAVQENKLDTVIEKLDRHCESEEKWRSGYDERLRTVETKQKEQAVELKHTIRNATGLNAAWTAVAAAIAGFVGSKS